MLNRHGIKITPEHVGYTINPGNRMGKPGPQHVRELMPRASKPNPTGDGRDAPLTGWRGGQKAEPTTSQHPRKGTGLGARKPELLEVRKPKGNERTRVNGRFVKGEA